MGKLINIGILGCASIAKRSVIPAILELKDLFNLAGIASREKEKAMDCAQQFGSLPFDYEALINEGDLDALYIPLPNSMHAEWIGKALDKGIHVLVEKSLATNFADVERLNNKAETSNLILMEHFQFRFHPQMAEIKRVLDSGVLGELRCMRATFGFPPFPDADNIRYQQSLGGGALLDAGAYPIKISQIILGNDLDVKAAKLNYDSARGVDIWGGGFLQQKNGPLFSEIAFGFDNYYQCNMELIGSKGKLTATRVFTAPPGFEAELILETSAGKEIIKVPAGNHFKNLLLHFNGLVKNTISADAEYAQNINQARLIKEFKTVSDE